MAPPEQRFPVSTLSQRVHGQLDTSGNLRSRKLPRDFDLKRDCQLMELVQYSCTPWQDMISLRLEGKRQQCWPVVRLFRRCGQGEKVFHVETTAWEGEGAWHGKPSIKKRTNTTGSATPATPRDLFANYGSYFWSKQG
ncbi:hypothetical protein GJ744_002038 [Endocarpon pusillum]|uniref:Uncharacterized protein n=1 Tax=Endocarpon pusillum TaxID=364733 RepID=A0A8H7E2Y4_9EURO|nr:hypothetical protein GJ744_002038 [Endocarpon pusillum]